MQAKLCGSQDFTLTPTLSLKGEGELKDPAGSTRAIAFGITSSSQAPFRGDPGVSPTEEAPGMRIKENTTVSDARVFITLRGGRL